MSLHRYKIEFATLTTDEKRNLIDKIETHSFSGLFWNTNFQSGEFLMEEPYNLNLLHVPNSCNLTRIL